MSYFAAAFARSEGEWVASEIDLDDVDSVEGVVDAVQQVETDDGIVLVFVEEENWFGVIRVEGDDEPRVYVSEAAEAMQSLVGEAVLSQLVEDYRLSEASDDEDEDEEPVVLPAEPIGEFGILDDLGIQSGDLNRLAEAIGTSPAAAVTFLADRLGFAEALEAVR